MFDKVGTGRIYKSASETLWRECDMTWHRKADGYAIKNNIFKGKTRRKHILHFSLSTRITRLVFSGLALFAQEFVDVALRWHGAFLDGSRDIHYLLLVLLLLLL
jgi:hypothetical protein